MANAHCKLRDPFPTDILSTIDLGNMDGHRDPLVEKGFVSTRSIEKFLLDNHSIIIGPFGSGKSALYNLLRTNSLVLKTFKDDLIVTIDEQIQFDEIKSASETYFPSLSEKLTYQLLWKFQVCRRISEELAKLDGFPSTDDEQYINEFLIRTGGIGGSLSITARIKNLFEKVSLKIKAKLSDIPVDIELSKEAEKAKHRIDLNLEEVVQRCRSITKNHQIRRCIVAIDKLDKFVAGEEYNTQRSYIESLLHLEDDMYGIEEIGFKIFLRSDLYERLDFSSLGPDKTEDNTLKLVWSKEEIRKFIARRLYITLEEAGAWNIRDIIDSSNISEFHPRWYEKILIDNKKDGLKYKIASFYSAKFGRRKDKTTFFGKIDLTVIDKIFEKILVHEDENGEQKQIPNYEFLTHIFLTETTHAPPDIYLFF